MLTAGGLTGLGGVTKSTCSAGVPFAFVPTIVTVPLPEEETAIGFVRRAASDRLLSVNWMLLVLVFASPRVIVSALAPPAGLAACC